MFNVKFRHVFNGDLFYQGLFWYSCHCYSYCCFAIVAKTGARNVVAAVVAVVVHCC